MEKTCGFLGLGKLGFPVAATMAWKGYQVMGYDVNLDVCNHEPREYKETGPDGIQDFNQWCKEHPKLRDNFIFGSLAEVAAHSEIIFVAVQTPHDPQYEGITVLPAERADFDYKFLKKALKDLSAYIQKDTMVVIISTVLPGTIRREILPHCSDFMKVVYSPLFIAMGQVMNDYLNPEFVLAGIETGNEKFVEEFREFYKPIHSAPIKVMSIESAESTKVLYNTALTMKISFANMVGEICHKIKHADCDDVIGALKGATDRLISTKYMNPGMGDGGGCHPRDNIALSWFAEKHDLHFDLFDAFMQERQQHCSWLGSLLVDYSYSTQDGIERLKPLPRVILGYTFKPETNIITGSPALLVSEIMSSFDYKVALWDPIRNPQDGADLPGIVKEEPRAYLIGCKHECFKDYEFAKGSVVIDPHRYLTPQRGVELVSIGSGPEGS